MKSILPNGWVWRLRFILEFCVEGKKLERSGEGGNLREAMGGSPRRDEENTRDRKVGRGKSEAKRDPGIGAWSWQRDSVGQGLARFVPWATGCAQEKGVREGQECGKRCPDGDEGTETEMRAKRGER
jgi:hypothetical protein